MTTPYGTTRFAYGEGPGVTRWLEITDPLGEKERIEFRHQAPAISGGARRVPTGVLTWNAYLDGRNTFYWNKRLMREYPGVYNAAKLYHWLHDLDPNTTSNVLESVIEPLEDRIWYSYPGQSQAGYLNGATQTQPARIGRVLEDDSTQLYQFEYNTRGKMTKFVDPSGRTFSYVYDINGIDLLEVGQTRGAAKDELLAKFTYNRGHQPLTSTDASGQTTTYTYNAYGQILTRTNPKNETTTWTYDDSGYLLSVNGPVDGATTTYTYDNFGRVQTITDSEGYALQFDYDALDRLTQITYPDGTFRQIVYDRLDPAQSIDRLGRVTQRTYNALRQLVSVQDPLNQVTQLEWCSCGDLQKLTDPRQQTTTWQRDGRGRVIRKVFADGQENTYRYDSASRLIRSLDEKGQRTQYEYYADNNIKRVTYSGTASGTPAVTFTYDPDYNRVRTMQDGTGATVFDYYLIESSPVLGAGRLARVTGPLPNSTITYGYDELGRVIRRSINGADATVTYDALARIIQANNSLGAFNYTYVNTTDRLLAVNYPNGQRTTFSYYDNTGDQRLQEIQNLNPAAALLSKFNYNYNAEGQITNWVRQTDAQPPTAYTFTYDDADQLVNVSLQSLAAENAVPGQYTYTYDSAGNRTSEQIDDALTPSSYNSLNQLTDQQAADLPNPEGVAYRSEMVYDGMGRRVRLTEKVNGVTISDRRFLWCKTQLCEERDATGGTVTKRFFEQGVSVIGGTNPGNYYYTFDHLGSVREMTDATGTVQALYDYDPFGRRTKVSGGLEADFGFTGHY